MYKTKGGFQLTLQTLSLVVGFMAWSIISPLMPYISQDVKVNPDSYLLYWQFSNIRFNFTCAIRLFN